jgi:hypothetical protein
VDGIAAGAHKASCALDLNDRAGLLSDEAR